MGTFCDSFCIFFNHCKNAKKSMFCSGKNLEEKCKNNN